jgi:adenylosuccinate synthase
VLHHSLGEYEELPGWSEDLTECRTWSDLPTAAREYLDYIAEVSGVPVVLAGVGPGREQIVWADGAEKATAFSPAAS